MPISILNSLASFGLPHFRPQSLNFFLILSTDRLQLCFDSQIKLLLVPLYFGDFKILVPSLKDTSHLIESPSSHFVRKYATGVLLELPIMLQCFEAVHL